MSGADRPLVEVPADDPAALLRALSRALDGTGPAVLPRGPHAPGGGPPLPDVLDREWSADACLVIETSGSTATPKRVVLEASALRASARATERRLDELFGRRPGDDVDRQWLLALPAEYVAGTQVLVRSLIAGTEPVVSAVGGFDAHRFAADAARLEGERRYTSLVPAQLIRLLDAAEAEDDAGGEVAAHVERFDGILVGGQATPPAVRERARALGWRVVATYGASETSGGCVYDGVPLDGIDARAEDGEVLLAGRVLAAGYLGDRERSDRAFVVDPAGRRWYRTGDAGEVLSRDVDDPAWAAARVRVTGRLDNVIVSGGEKVLLDRVERAVRGVRGFEQAVVVAAPSVEWGAVPVVVAERDALGDAGCPEPVSTGHTLDEVAADALREWPVWQELRTVCGEIGRAARPVHLFVGDGLPALRSSKPDRLELERLVERALRR
ncbi:O-succinylbenzoic acid--CoA ligase [Pseudoclavibacter chungangensis]|uniref:AMP-binding protein n=1 Tax=Pseudoclavibacter chungangensis TaxID=587635 RepID=UPI001854CB3F|nr:AMP-binding protein [Pseudoclavibacter chungangensis]NYJ67891.1 O-succinylbenzoic acid--CoA ligase [Pseudoclavibacter chungangensis]